jgi:hypothetical protein
MAKRKKQKGGEPSVAYVPVIYARNLTEAEFYKGLLTSNDIPAVIEDEGGESTGMPASVVGQGLPVLVPDEMLNEASQIIAEHEDTEEDEELDEYEEFDEEASEEFDEDTDEELDEELEDEDLEKEEETEDLDELNELDDDLDEDDDVEDLDPDEEA